MSGLFSGPHKYHEVWPLSLLSYHSQHRTANPVFLSTTGFYFLCYHRIYDLEDLYQQS